MNVHKKIDFLWNFVTFLLEQNKQQNILKGKPENFVLLEILGFWVKPKFFQGKLKQVYVKLANY